MGNEVPIWFLYTVHIYVPIANFDSYTLPIRKKPFSMNSYTDDYSRTNEIRNVINKGIRGISSVYIYIHVAHVPINLSLIIK